MPILVVMFFVLSFSLGSCVSFKPPSRPAHNIADTVSQLTASQIVGKWRVEDINPPPESGAKETIIEYRSDGTVSGTLTSDLNPARTSHKVRVKLSGNWTLNGDTVTHTNISMSSIDNDPASQLLSQMINSSSQQLGGRANVYELSTDHMVMVGSDGAAMEYTRLQP